MSDTYVYFIRVGRYLKVGISTDPAKRCKNLMASSTRYSKPWDAPTAAADRELLGYVYGESDAEFYAHEALRLYGVGCEFFLDEPGSREYVRRCLAAGRILRDTVIREAGQAEFVGQVEPDPDGPARLRASLNRMDFLLRGGAA